MSFFSLLQSRGKYPVYANALASSNDGAVVKTEGHDSKNSTNSSGDHPEQVLDSSRQRLDYRTLQEQVYRQAVAQQHQLNQSRQLDLAYLHALYDFRQRGAMLSLDLAVRQAQMQRQSLTAGLSSLNNSVLNSRILASSPSYGLLFPGHSTSSPGISWLGQSSEADQLNFSQRNGVSDLTMAQGQSQQPSSPKSPHRSSRK